ncbi:hypothetical protein PIB30_089406 [Stylosanthes scabra]|uniref:Uncharacterized protein n=1 Tax=Stylosanthes scabra TaxID=79078 RepID=A0ABU6UTF5_9FABA|nr:hypothetical protein [Stylosanthes scabra]
MIVTVHDGDLRGTQQYYEWFAHVARHGRFLSKAWDLADPRWNLAPPDIPPAAVHPRDELVMPDDAPAPRRRGGHERRPRQAAPVRGKLSLQDQRRRTRMLVVGAAAHLEEERAEEQREYDRRDESGQAGGGEAFHDDQPDTHEQQTQEHTGLDELFQMTLCPSAEFTSIVETFRMSRAQHVDHGSSSSATPPPPPPPASTVQHGLWIPTYSSPPVMEFPVFDPSRVGSEHSTPMPTMTHPHHSSTELDHGASDPPASDIPAANPPLPPPTDRPHRATRPPPCGTGGHIDPRGGRQ